MRTSLFIISLFICLLGIQAVRVSPTQDELTAYEVAPPTAYGIAAPTAYDVAAPTIGLNGDLNNEEDVRNAIDSIEYNVDGDVNVTTTTECKTNVTVTTDDGNVYTLEGGKEVVSNDVVDDDQVAEAIANAKEDCSLCDHENAEDAEEPIDGEKVTITTTDIEEVEDGEEVITVQKNITNANGTAIVNVTVNETTIIHTVDVEGGETTIIKENITHIDEITEDFNETVTEAITEAEIETSEDNKPVIVIENPSVLPGRPHIEEHNSTVVIDGKPINVTEIDAESSEFLENGEEVSTDSHIQITKENDVNENGETTVTTVTNTTHIGNDTIISENVTEISETFDFEEQGEEVVEVIKNTTTITDTNGTTVVVTNNTNITTVDNTTIETTVVETNTTEVDEDGEDHTSNITTTTNTTTNVTEEGIYSNTTNTTTEETEDSIETITNNTVTTPNQTVCNETNTTTITELNDDGEEQTITTTNHTITDTIQEENGEVDINTDTETIVEVTVDGETTTHVVENTTDVIEDGNQTITINNNTYVDESGEQVTETDIITTTTETFEGTEDTEISETVVITNTTESINGHNTTTTNTTTTEHKNITNGESNSTVTVTNTTDDKGNTTTTEVITETTVTNEEITGGETTTTSNTTEVVVDNVTNTVIINKTETHIDKNATEHKDTVTIDTTPVEEDDHNILFNNCTDKTTGMNLVIYTTDTEVDKYFYYYVVTPGAYENLNEITENKFDHENHDLVYRFIDTSSDIRYTIYWSIRLCSWVIYHKENKYQGSLCVKKPPTPEPFVPEPDNEVDEYEADETEINPDTELPNPEEPETPEAPEPEKFMNRCLAGKQELYGIYTANYNGQRVIIKKSVNENQTYYIYEFIVPVAELEAFFADSDVVFNKDHHDFTYHFSEPGSGIEFWIHWQDGEWALRACLETLFLEQLTPVNPNIPTPTPTPTPTPDEYVDPVPEIPVEPEVPELNFDAEFPPIPPQFELIGQVHARPLFFNRLVKNDRDTVFAIAPPDTTGFETGLNQKYTHAGLLANREPLYLSLDSYTWEGTISFTYFIRRDNFDSITPHFVVSTDKWGVNIDVAEGYDLTYTVVDKEGDELTSLVVPLQAPLESWAPGVDIEYKKELVEKLHLQ